MKKITERIKLGEVLVSNGSWGTFLHAREINHGTTPEHIRRIAKAVSELQ